MEFELDMIFWIIALVFFILVEISTCALVSIWFVLGCLASFIAACFNVSILDQCVIFTAVSVFTFLIVWPFIGKMKVEKTPTNADSFIGLDGVVVNTIDNVRSEGRVTVNGLEWSARSADGSMIEVGKIIVVKELQGVKLIVSEKN